MTAEDDKRAAIGLLEREWHSLDEWLRSLDDRQLDRPMFGEAPGWGVRDMPTHMAWWQELAVAAAAGVLFGYAWWRRQRRPGPRSGRLWLLAPLGKPAARRAARTVRGGVRRRSGLGPLLAAPAACSVLARAGSAPASGRWHGG